MVQYSLVINGDNTVPAWRRICVFGGYLMRKVLIGLLVVTLLLMSIPSLMNRVNAGTQTPTNTSVPWYCPSDGGQTSNLVEVSAVSSDALPSYQCVKIWRSTTKSVAMADCPSSMICEWEVADTGNWEMVAGTGETQQKIKTGIFFFDPNLKPCQVLHDEQQRVAPFADITAANFGCSDSGGFLLLTSTPGAVATLAATQ